MNKFLSYFNNELSTPITGRIAGIFLLASVAGFVGGGNLAKYEQQSADAPLPSPQAIPASPEKITAPFAHVPGTKPEFAVQVALQLAAEKTRLPLDFMTRLAEAESGMNPTAKAKTSNACGMTQLTPDVIYSYLFKHGQRHGFEEAALIQRTRFESDDGVITLKYGLYNDGDKAIIDSSCQNPEFAAIIGAEYMRDIAVYLQKILHKEQLLSDEAYAGFIFGKKGSVRLIEAFNDPDKQHHAAKDLASKRAVRNNPNLFFKDPENKLHPRSVAELNGILEGKIGTKKLPHIEPRDRDSFQLASAQP